MGIVPEYTAVHPMALGKVFWVARGKTSEVMEVRRDGGEKGILQRMEVRRNGSEKGEIDGGEKGTRSGCPGQGVHGGVPNFHISAPSSISPTRWGPEKNPGPQFPLDGMLLPGRGDWDRRWS